MRASIVVGVLLFWVGCGDDGGPSDGATDAGGDSAPGDTGTGDTGTGDTSTADAGDSATGRIDFCEGAGDCTLSYNAGCCAPCERAVASDYDAVNTDHTDEHRRMSCPEWPVGCAPCETPPPPNPALAAGCDLAASTCTRLDLEDATWTTCTDDVDCVLVAPVCCDCRAFAIEEIVAIRADRQSDLAQYLCDPRADCADPCVPTLPAEASAVCTGGRCTIAAP